MNETYVRNNNKSKDCIENRNIYWTVLAVLGCKRGLRYLTSHSLYSHSPICVIPIFPYWVRFTKHCWLVVSWKYCREPQDNTILVNSSSFITQGSCFMNNIQIPHAKSFVYEMEDCGLTCMISLFKCNWHLLMKVCTWLRRRLMSCHLFNEWSMQRNWIPKYWQQYCNSDSVMIWYVADKFLELSN